MTKHWIFVSSSYSDFNRGPFSEIMDNVQQSGKWPIGKKTLRRYLVSADDKIIFYQAGENSKEFVASGRLLSALQKDKNSLFDYVLVGDIKSWDRHVPIRTLLDRLPFVKDKKHWGLYLKGGIVHISEEDYKLILKKAGLKPA